MFPSCSVPTPSKSMVKACRNLALAALLFFPKYETGAQNTVSFLAFESPTLSMIASKSSVRVYRSTSATILTLPLLVFT